MDVRNQFARDAEAMAVPTPREIFTALRARLGLLRRQPSTDSSAADFLCKGCVSFSACTISVLQAENPLRLLRRYAQGPISTAKPRIYVVPEDGVEPSRF